MTSCVYLWVNGKFVGYSEDSKIGPEFDVTKYLKKGENQFAFQVFRWSDGSYCEDQDFWRLYGIFRDVYLYAIPKVHVQDLLLREIMITKQKQVNWILIWRLVGDYEDKKIKYVLSDQKASLKKVMHLLMLTVNYL